MLTFLLAFAAAERVGTRYRECLSMEFVPLSRCRQVAKNRNFHRCQDLISAEEINPGRSNGQRAITTGSSEAARRDAAGDRDCNRSCWRAPNADCRSRPREQTRKTNR